MTEQDQIRADMWWVCAPGCLPDSDAFGPFEDSDDATDDAIRSWVEGRE